MKNKTHFDLIRFNNRLVAEELGYFIMSEISSYTVRYIDYIDEWRFDFGKRIVEFCSYLKRCSILGYRAIHNYPSIPLWMFLQMFIFQLPQTSPVINNCILDQILKVGYVGYESVVFTHY